MKTKFIKTIDNEKIIIGLGLGYLDQELTRPKTKSRVEASKEFKQAEEIRRGMVEKYYQINDDRKKGQRLAERLSQKNEEPTPEEITQIKTINNRILENTGILKRKNNELKRCHPHILKAEKEINNKYGIFFQTKKYEEKVTEEQASIIAEKLLEAKRTDSWLLNDLTLVKKVKNKVFVSEDLKFSYPKTITDCKNLDFVKFIELQEFLSTATDEKKQEVQEALNNERMANLTPEQKEAEKQNALTGAKAQAVNLKSQLEIEGDKDAIKKAQEWLKEETKQIEKLYK